MSTKILYKTSARATGGRDGHAATLDGAFDVKLTTPLSSENDATIGLLAALEERLIWRLPLCYDRPRTSERV